LKLRLTPDASTRPNRTLFATINATFGPAAAPIAQTLFIPLQVVAPGAVAIANASTAALQTGATALAAVLNGLSVALTALVKDPASPAFKSQALAALDSILSLLLVRNTGHTEDAFTATIMGTSGPVPANLAGLDGQPAQTIPLFRLPGLGTGTIVLNASISATATGTVTVAVTTLWEVPCLTGSCSWAQRSMPAPW
jgi:hypothetical protein